MEQVERRRRRHEHQAGVLDDALHPVVQGQPRGIEGVRDVVVELGVLIVGDVALGLHPQGTRVVQLARDVAFLQPDRQGNVVRVGLDDALDLRRLQVLPGVLVEVQPHARAARRVVGAGGDLIPALAVARPRPGGGLAGPARRHFDPVGDHEGGVEADAELADQAHVRLVALHLVDERRGAGARDRSQVLHQVVAVHADAVVDDAQGRGARVGVDDDLEFGVVGQQVALRQRGIAQLVAGVGGVGDQLAQEDLLVAVERVRDDIEQAADFRLEFVAFLMHGALVLRLLIPPHMRQAVICGSGRAVASPRA